MTRPTRRQLLWGLLAAVVLVAAGWLAYSRLERKQERILLPLLGEASYNPLYALGRTLEGAGQKVAARRRLELSDHPLGAQDTVVLFGDPQYVSESDADALLAWVERGGHLLVRTPGLRGPEGSRDAKDEPALVVPLLAKLGVEPLADRYCLGLRVEGENEHQEFCRGRAFDVPGEPELWWGVEDETAEGDESATDDAVTDGAASDGTAVPDAGTAGVAPTETADAGSDAGDDDTGEEYPEDRALGFARLRHGRGSVDVLADLDFLDNGDHVVEPPPPAAPSLPATGNAPASGARPLPRPATPAAAGAGTGSGTPATATNTALPYRDGGLRDGPHRALAAQLLAPNWDKGTFHLIYASQRASLWRTWLYEGWPAWAPLLLALGAWWWRRAQRFGPWLPPLQAERRSLLEHVRASGALVYRYGRASILHAAVRHAFETRLRRRDPAAAVLRGEARIQAVATRLGIDPAVLRDALASPGSNDAAAFRRRIATLLQLRNRL